MGSTSKAVAQKNYDAQIQTNLSNERNVDKTNAANLSLAQMQNKWNVQQWERNNAYNDPSAQLMRLKNAGLSSAAAAQAVSGVPSSPVQSAELGTQESFQATAPQYNLPDSAQANPANIIGLGRQIAGFMSDLANVKKEQNEAAASDTFFLTRNDLLKNQLEQGRTQLGQSVAMFPYSLNAMKYASVSAFNDARKSFNEVNKSSVEYQIMQENLTKVRTENSFLKERSEAEIKTLYQGIKESSARINDLKASASLKSAQTDTEKVKAEKEKLGNEYQQIVNSLAKFGTPESQAQRIGVLIADGKITAEDVESAFLNTKKYLMTGKDTFLADPATNNYYRFVLDEGYKNIPATHGYQQAQRIQESLVDFGSWIDNLYKDYIK